MIKRYTKVRKYDENVLNKLHSVQVQILSDFIAVCEKYNLTYFVVYGTAIGAVRHHGFIPWDDDIDVAMLREDYDKFCKIFPKELGKEYSLLTPEMDGRYACTVTHIQKKGTKFVSEASQDLKCEQCIFMDIFPLDYVAKEKRAALRQARYSNILGRLLFLSGTAYPVIPYKGVAGKIAKIICVMIHYFLKILRITPCFLYKKYVSVVTRYNGRKDKSEYVTSFEYANGLKDRVKRDELFPIQKISFESLQVNIPANNHEFLTKVYGDYMKIPPEEERVNHMPLIIQFEGEEPIYGR